MRSSYKSVDTVEMNGSQDIRASQNYGKQPVHKNTYTNAPPKRMVDTDPEIYKNLSNDGSRRERLKR